jgi:cyanophycin synthetase
MLMLARGEHRIPLVEAARLPFTLNGRARHNVENALAACAALVALGIARERIVAGLSTFTSGASHNPLRLNVFRTRGVTLLVDYAHNVAAYRAIIATARQLTTRRLHGVVAAPGDRRDDDLVEIGRVCRAGFDELVVYEMDEARDRPPGATARRIHDGATQVAPAAGARIVLDVREAIRTAVHCGTPRRRRRARLREPSRRAARCARRPRRDRVGRRRRARDRRRWRAASRGSESGCVKDTQGAEAPCGTRSESS